MSFLRPEAVAAVRRYAEPVVYAAIASALAWKGIGLIGRGAWIGLAPLVLAGLAAIAAIGTAERALVARRSVRAGPGIVSVQEGSITYFGPHGGASMALDTLVRVDILRSGGRFAPETRWELTDEAGERLSIPAGAANAGTLVDVLGGLPGFSNMAVVLAMEAGGPDRRPVWRREPGPPLPFRPGRARP